MKTSQIVGIIFVINGIILGFITKMWVIGLPMGIVGLCFLTGVISDDSDD